MIQIIHISDTHIKGNDSDKTVSQLLTKIYNRHFNNAQGVYLAVTGDIVDSALEFQYQKAQKILAPFSHKLLLSLGNHDCGILGNLYSPDSINYWKKYFQPFTINNVDYTTKNPVEILLEYKDTKVLTMGLNSCLLTYKNFDFACGMIGEDQLDKVREVFNKSTNMDLPKLVYCHHRPFPLSFPENKVMELQDANDLFEVVDETADVVMYGHSGGGLEHRTRAPKTNGVPLLDTQYLNANDFVDTGRYFQVMFSGSNPPLIYQRNIKE
jgi:3',5'-cyclic AMP phosphodiesterase CpdA